MPSVWPECVSYLNCADPPLDPVVMNYDWTSAKGTSQQTIHEDTFLTYLIPLPPKEIQLEIINILGKIIALNERQIEINQLFADLFPSVLQTMFDKKNELELK